MLNIELLKKTIFAFLSLDKIRKTFIGSNIKQGLSPGQWLPILLLEFCVLNI